MFDSIVLINIEDYETGQIGLGDSNDCLSLLILLFNIIMQKSLYSYYN